MIPGTQHIYLKMSTVLQLTRSKLGSWNLQSRLMSVEELETHSLKIKAALQSTEGLPFKNLLDRKQTSSILIALQNITNSEKFMPSQYSSLHQSS